MSDQGSYILAIIFEPRGEKNGITENLFILETSRKFPYFTAKNTDATSIRPSTHIPTSRTTSSRSLSPFSSRAQ